ncbi:substrate-binding periplasmic protein [Glaciecola siphonariae]|uniref:Substrate-binding periplasmic protein n=1 Tax=Glaciecola siphonariae TaxID=521012 RepID=A0ABV9LSW8_9ALTE
MFKNSLIGLSLASLLTICSHAHSATYKIRNLDGGKEEIAAKILKLALSKVEPSVELVQHDEVMTEGRLMQAIEENEIDILWAGAAKDKEERMLTVRIPILKGLLGHRIFIIRKEDKARFESIKTRADLDKFFAGQGTFWGDTKVLQHAKLPTVTTIKYENHFPMLEGGRFDYFPRAVHEPWTEVETHADLNLMVDQTVMLIYPYAMWFFVNKDNQALHDKIYKGFEMAIADGSYDELFFSIPMIKEALENANLADRVVFKLENPYMHPDTPTDRKEFWLNINDL